MFCLYKLIKVPQTNKQMEDREKSPYLGFSLSPRIVHVGPNFPFAFQICQAGLQISFYKGSHNLSLENPREIPAHVCFCMLATQKGAYKYLFYISIVSVM